MGKWVSIYGNAPSISEYKAAMYSKNVTLRYPIFSNLTGNKLKLTLDNFFGDEPITITAVTVAIGLNDLDYKQETRKQITFNNSPSVTIEAGGTVECDPVDFCVEKGQKIIVSVYLGDFTSMRSGVFVKGPLSNANFITGDVTNVDIVNHNDVKKLSFYYFLTQVDIYSETGESLLCFGDSITAQSWPDYLAQMYHNDGSDTTVIRRAVSGTRILREYNNLSYLAYGKNCFNRAEHELTGESVDKVVILQGINDIIHPVGVEVNEFRPWSDLPTVEEMIDGLRFVISTAKAKGYKVYVGTLLPVYGWRTYAQFRDDLRNQFNNWIRTTDEIDGFIDLDESVRDPLHPERFADVNNSGDNLHPSESGYKAMAEAVYNYFHK